VALDGSVPLGEVLAAQAEVGEAGVETGATRASAATRVESGVAMGLGAEVNPDPVRPGELFQVVLSLANQGLVASDAQLSLRLPGQFAALAAALTEGGSCGTVNCVPTQRVVWNLAGVGAGAGRSVSVMPMIAAAVPNGTVVPLEILLTESSSGQWRRARRSVLVEDGRNLDLGLDEDRDPAEPGDALTYTLTFGNRSAALAPDTQLRLPLPAGTSFLNAPGAVLVDGVVTWDVGTLAPGQGGTRELTVALDGSVPLGEVLAAQAEVGEAGVETGATRASAATRVESGVPVELSMAINPDPANQAGLLAVALEVMNLAPVNANVSLSVRVPSQVQAFAAASTGGGSCGTVNCVGTQIVTWQFPMLPPDGEGFVQLPPTVAQVPDGTVVPFESWARESTGAWRRLRRSVRVE
jgi:uncharacterized repeat protein (TIGR01451 family)